MLESTLGGNVGCEDIECNLVEHAVVYVALEIDEGDEHVYDVVRDRFLGFLVDVFYEICFEFGGFGEVAGARGVGFAADRDVFGFEVEGGFPVHEAGVAGAEAR